MDLKDELIENIKDSNDFVESLLSMDEESFWNWILFKSDTYPFTPQTARMLIVCLLIKLRSAAQV